MRRWPMRLLVSQVSAPVHDELGLSAYRRTLPPLFGRNLRVPERRLREGRVRRKLPDLFEMSEVRPRFARADIAGDG